MSNIAMPGVTLKSQEYRGFVISWQEPPMMGRWSANIASESPDLLRLMKQNGSKVIDAADRDGMIAASHRYVDGLLGSARPADDERKALQKARATLSAITPNTARIDAIALPLQFAARIATSASTQGFSSDAGVNELRGEAAIALNGVAGSLGGPNLTQDLIDRARRAVADLLAATEGDVS